MLSLNKRAAQLGPAVEQAVVADESVSRIGNPTYEDEKLALEKAERDAAEKAARVVEKKPVSRNDIPTYSPPRETKPKPSSFKILGIGLLALAILSLGSRMTTPKPAQLAFFIF